MENEDRKALKKNVASMPCDTEKEIEIHGGAGEMGINVFNVTQWENKCKSYFSRYYKTSSTITVPSDRDTIMNTLVSVCFKRKSRGFVFKNYDIAKHLEFLGYAEVSLKEKLGAVLVNKSISYIAYIEQKNALLICEKVSAGSNMDQCLKNIALMVKYFLTLYHRVIQASRVKVIGLLIRGKEQQEELVKCKFCHLFSLSNEDFETNFDNWLNSIEIYEGWWNLANAEKQSNLFDCLAAEILCFMAVQEKGLPSLTADKREQFKQTYFLYTRQQMDIHFSNAKHVVIQGSYGSGKSLLGLKKLELILKNLGQHEKIIYINFDCKSNLHLLMEKNVKEYVRISSRKIKRTNGIGNILKSPRHLIYVCHNSTGENLSAIFRETLRLNMNTSENAKKNYHLIIEEYDGEELIDEEAAKITNLVKGSELMESNIIILAQPIMKNRSWSIGKRSYERETCMFHELENTFKIVKLEEVLRCCNEICEITKSTQNFVRNKDSVFNTNTDKHTLEQQQLGNNKRYMISPSVSEWDYPEAETSVNEYASYPSSNSIRADKSLDRTMDLDQAFKKSATLKKGNAAKSKIVSKFGFLCEPRQGVDIMGLKPNLVEFSKDINFTGDMVVISLASILKNLIAKNETTTFLHMADEQPAILKRIFQVLRKLDKTFLFTQDIEEYLHKDKQCKMIFSSNFRSVNGMEFDHVIILVSQSEYYLKYYLPQAISRCTYDLTFLLLPEENKDIRKGTLSKISNIFQSTRNNNAKETVANLVEELKREFLVKQVVVAECKACEKCFDCYCISNETDNKQIFGVHTHSVQYKGYLSLLVDFTKLEEKSLDTIDSALADAK